MAVALRINHRFPRDPATLCVSNQPPKSTLHRPAAELLAGAIEPLQGLARPLAGYLARLEGRMAARSPWLVAAWIAFVVLMLAARFVDLRADYPLDYPTPQARSFLRDGFLYSDEGWYAAGALRWYRTGDWYLAGDLNLAVVLPIQQLMHAVSFTLLGANIEAARTTGLVSLMGACVLTYLLVRRFEAPWVALLAVSTMAANEFFFAHNRIAIGENPMMLWTTAAALAATYAKGPRAAAFAAMAGVLLLLGTLTKTPAILLAPFMALGIVALSGWRSMGGWVAGTIFGAIVLGGYLVWQSAMLHYFPHDVDYFNAINVRMRAVTSPYAFSVTAYFFFFQLAMVDRVYYWFILVGVSSLMLLSRSFRNHPLMLPCLGIVVWWFLVFSLYGNRQFRYFVAIAPAVAILVAVGLRFLWEARAHSPLQRVLAWSVALSFAATMAMGAATIITALCFPRYSTAEAAHWIAATMHRTDAGNNVLLGHTSCTIALYEDLIPLNDLYMTGPLEERLDAFRPRFLLAETPVDYAPWVAMMERTDRDPRSPVRRLEVLRARYRIVELAQLRILRNYSDRDFRFYRLDPLAAPSGS